MTAKINKDILKELSKISKKVGVSLKSLIFGSGENILLIKNNIEEGNISKSMKENKITMQSKIDKNYMRTTINVPANYTNKEPIHFCFILDKKGTKQAVQPIWHIGKNSKVKIFAYCFGLEYDVMHGDGKKYFIDDNASLEVYEFNYNAMNSYMTVYNNFHAELKENSYFKNYYVSTVGHLGYGNTKGKVICKGKNSKAEFITKNIILNDDVSNLDISFYLEGEQSSGLIISKTITHKGGTNKFIGKMYGIGKNTKGHMECDEISLGKCSISTSPTLFIENSTSTLTHEASVGTLEKKTIENLMIKGFDKKQAVQFLINGILDSI